MPTPRGAAGVAAIDGKIFVAGGYGGGEAASALESYDPKTDSWTRLASMAYGRDHLAAVAVNGKLYAIGGRIREDRGRNLHFNEVYDPARDSWSELSPLPTARSGIAAAAVDGRIYVLGGERPSGVYPQNEVLDIEANKWEAAEPMLTPRHGTGAAVIDGVIYIPGGGAQAGIIPTEVNEAFAP
jgi:N-acetylneuraminic acid mutarotase